MNQMSVHYLGNGPLRKKLGNEITLFSEQLQLRLTFYFSKKSS